jgi:hypothetical protein
MKTPLGEVYLADFFKQTLEVVIVKESPISHPFPVNQVSAQGIVPQHTRSSPLPESRCAFGVYPIPNGDNCVKIVALNLIIFSVFLLSRESSNN